MRNITSSRCFTALSIVLFALVSSGLIQPQPAIAQANTAGFIVSPGAGLITSESGQEAQFTIVLTAAPLADGPVHISLQSSHPSEGLPSPANVNFNINTWDQPLTITVTGQDDPVDDGDQDYTIETLAAESNDPAYSGLNPDDVSLTNQDNDTAGFSINPVSGLVTSETRQTDKFTVRLNTSPLTNVQVTLLSSNTGEGTVSPDTMTFTPDNWQTTQTATLTGQDDPDFDGTQSYTIVTDALSDDPSYSNNPPDVSAENLDNDQVTVTARPNNYSLTQDQTLSEPAPGVLANDDTNSGSLTAEVDSSPSNGSLTLNANGAFEYTPNPGFFGSDSFTYRASNGSQVSDPATVSLSVDQQIVVTATPDSYTTNQNQDLTQSAPGVLANDNTNSGSLRAELVSSVDHGSLSFKPNGSFVYTPASGYSGPDSFTYRARNGAVASNPTTVSLNVSLVVVVVAQPDVYTTNENLPLTRPAPGVLANDNTNSGSLTAVLVSNVGHGTLALSPDGSFVYTPTAAYTGPDSFTYRAANGSIVSPPTRVSLTVLLTNSPPSAANDGYLTNVANPVTYTVSAPGVLKNDNDPEKGLLAAALLTQPAQGSVVLTSNGAFTYTPLPGFNGQTSFTYTATDAGGKTANAKVTIEVDSVAPPPINWVLPDANGTVNSYTNGQIQLEVFVEPGVTDVDHVVFYLWDPQLNQRIEIGSASRSPYVTTIDSSSLHYKFNQIDAAAFDRAGNRSDLRHIWVVRNLPPVVYLAIVSR